MEQKQKQPIKYPNAALFGFTCGIAIQMFTHYACQEPLSARPLSYLKLGAFWGILMF